MAIAGPYLPWLLNGHSGNAEIIAASRMTRTMRMCPRKRNNAQSADWVVVL